MKHILKVKSAKKAFGDYVVFNNFNYAFESGKIYALVGPSGCGKTTLLNSIGRLNDLSSGNIFLDGEDIQAISTLKYYRNYIGYLFQNYALVDEETILQNLNIVKKFESSIIEKSLEKFDLNTEYLNRKIFTLSGGEAQRVALTRLDLQDPLIVLADEPTGALDHKNRQLVLESLRNMAKEGKIVIVATHDDVVKTFADEYIDISQYKLV